MKKPSKKVSSTGTRDHPKNERSLVIIKPDGLQRSLIGEIIKRYERSGLKLVGIKMLIPTEEMIERHYTLDPEWKLKTGRKNLEAYAAKGLKPPTTDPIEQSNMILAKLKKYLTSGPVVAMVWQGMHAVGIIRKITGGTEPLTSGVGTIRGDFVLDSYQVADNHMRAVRNLVHASGAISEADDEIAYWFKPHELFNYRLLNETILYDVNLEGILE